MGEKATYLDVSSSWSWFMAFLTSHCLRLGKRTLKLYIICLSSRYWHKTIQTCKCLDVPCVRQSFALCLSTYHVSPLPPKLATSMVAKSHQSDYVTSSQWYGLKRRKSHQGPETHIRKCTSAWHSRKQLLWGVLYEQQQTLRTIVHSDTFWLVRMKITLARPVLDLSTSCLEKHTPSNTSTRRCSWLFLC